MAIDNRHDFHAFSALRGSDFCPTAFSHYKCRIDEAFSFIECTSVAKLVGNIRQCPPQGLIAAPSLEASVHRFVVWKALWQHMPLCTRVEDPQDHLKHATCRDRFSTRPIIRNVFFRKM